MLPPVFDKVMFGKVMSGKAVNRLSREAAAGIEPRVKRSATLGGIPTRKSPERATGKPSLPFSWRYDESAIETDLTANSS